MHVMILGAGYSGKAIALNFLQSKVQVTGTTRSADRLSALFELGISGLIFDGKTISADLAQRFTSVTHLIQSISPSGELGGHDPFLSLINNDLTQHFPNLEWLAYLSTVGVYGDHRGEWVDEETMPKPVSKRSIERLQAEVAWQNAARQADHPLAILRLSGIYGPGRNAFVNLERGNAKRLIKQGQVFNRIRVEDIASSCTYLSAAKSNGVFNITDSMPCPPQDVVTYAASLMQVPAPPEQPFEQTQLSPMARSFYGENKRVSNAKIRKLGFEFAYPDYENSLNQLWESGRWSG